MSESERRQVSKRIQERLVNLFESAPISCSQAAIGVILHIGFTRSACSFLPRPRYHPRLAWRLYGNVIGFLVLGATTFDVVSRVASILLYQTAVERRLNGEGDQIKNGKTIKNGVEKYHHDGTSKTLVQWLVTENLFFKVQAAIYVVLVATETAMGAPALSPATPYTMVASLDFAMRWLWAFTADQESTTLLGFIPIKSVLLPLFQVTLQRFRSAQAMAKGFIAAAVVCQLMQLKRTDGKLALQWYAKKLQEVAKTCGRVFDKRR
ncbi:hypothetical protein SeMB42_g04789 [Synchytrium endobioticum]|uniref:Uncharacterized protein n=1 Tax=Synchytrium endobioticum TaxID=286115 RepID=A0A507CVU7_9FUNG|nr:hypothetical protein SeLEV6574_g06183 [Synchytrium endobioticum]TPX43283.1 hypothetical protein SeMB42_g04789 [Synchytrium endobioticum]